MSAATAEVASSGVPRGHRPPAVADGEPPSTLTGLRRELLPQPGRLANALRLTATALLIVAICEIFRIPSGATAAYIAFILVKADADAAIPAALLGGAAIVAGILITIVYFAATLSEPALRLPLMAVITFGAVYLSRCSTLGTAAFAAGLFMIMGLVQGDDVMKGALSPDTDSNVEGPGLPALLSMPPEETLVHNLLWTALAIGVAAATIVVVSRLTLVDPERKLRAAVADRLRVMADLCAGDSGARQRLAELARHGATALKAQNTLAGTLKRGRYRPAFGTAVIDAVSQLTLVLLAIGRLPRSAAATARLAAASDTLSAAAAAIRDGTPMPPPTAPDTTEPEGAPDTERGPSLDREVARCVLDLRRAIDGTDQQPEPSTGAGFFTRDAFSDPEHTRFALKVTLALMASYLFMDLSDWSQISTCMTTCYVLAASGVGQSVHKMGLRIAGALAGAAFGFGAILFVMPLLTDLGQLLCVMAPVLLAAAWVRVGGERTGYFGQQMGFAFMLMMVQDYGPTLDFQTGRNRLVGILVGEVAFMLVFLHVWPVSVAALVRATTGAALGRLADALTTAEPRGRADALQAFVEALDKARALVIDARYEPDRIRRRGAGPTIDEATLLDLQSLAVPAAALRAADPGGDASRRSACDAYLTGLSAWLKRFAGWIEGGGDIDAVLAARPRVPSLPARDPEASQAAWCQTLDQDLGTSLATLGLAARAPAR